MHKIEAMSPAERERTMRNDGVLEMYTPENLKIRQELYIYNPRVNAWLERWWSAASRFLDRDHSHTLTLDEYAEFHQRLQRLLDDPSDQLSADEALSMMKADFEADDMNHDGLIDRKEFRYAVFQLADVWTTTLHEDDYVKFLERGYDGA